MESTFVDIECTQERKYGQSAFGDCFISRRLPEQNRVIAVLSDGLGSGIKANVLSTMTAHMALRFIASDSEIISSVQVMMEALPVCRVRGISYATFTIVDYREGGGVRVIAFDSPGVIRLSGGQLRNVFRRALEGGDAHGRTVFISEFDIEPGDRLIFTSDGVVQSGLGSGRYPTGWGEEGVAEFVRDTVLRHPGISALTLSGSVVSAALTREPQGQAHDDISCAVMHFRAPRRTLIVTGPPASDGDDAALARTLREFSGRRVICGGTTCRIISRETGIEAFTDPNSGGDGVPPCATMEGVDLVTEGVLTLNRTAELLETRSDLQKQNNPAARLVRLLRESDIIRFVVGTRQNESYLADEMTNNLELRRNVVRRIAACLERDYLRQVEVEYL